MKDIRYLRVDVKETHPGYWVWSVSDSKRVLCTAAKTYRSKGACLKAFYEVQDYVIHARVFINGGEQR